MFCSGGIVCANDKAKRWLLVGARCRRRRQWLDASQTMFREWRENDEI